MSPILVALFSQEVKVFREEDWIPVPIGGKLKDARLIENGEEQIGDPKDSGWWAVFNALMIVAHGKNYDPIPSPDNILKIRTIFQRFGLELAIK